MTRVLILVCGVSLFASSSADAACVLSGARPTGALPTGDRGQQLVFQTNGECSALRFSAQGNTLSKTPRAGADGRTYKVALTDGEWRIATDTSDTFTWTIAGRSTDGSTVQLRTVNELDFDGDGWTRTEGDVGRCDLDPLMDPTTTDTCADALSVCLVSEWLFHGNADDTSGNFNDGRAHGASFTTDRNGAPDSAYHFDGINDYIGVPDSASLSSVEANGALTVAAWVYVEGWYLDWNVFAIIEKYRASNDDCWEYILATEPTDVMSLVTSGFQSTSTPFRTSFDQWYFVAVTYDGVEALFYVDGALIGSAPYARALGPTGGGDVHIGWSACGPDEYSEGIIDDLYVFDCALSDDEIADLSAM